MGRDFVPQKGALYVSFATAFVGSAQVYRAALGIPQALAEALQAELAAYAAAHNACEAPNAGKLDREDRAEKRAALTADIRRTKNGWIDPNPSGAVTQEIRLAFGLRPRDGTRTKARVPVEEVRFSLRHGDYGQVVVARGARPANCNGALALFKVVPPGGPVPALEELVESRLLTMTHETLQFAGAQTSHTLYVTLVWQNSRGKRGPAAPVQKIVIA
ncbi:MAG: hypothetical protein MdMp014T_0701 [Treponematales bacterium]